MSEYKETESERRKRRYKEDPEYRKRKLQISSKSQKKRFKENKERFTIARKKYRDKCKTTDLQGFREKNRVKTKAYRDKKPEVHRRINKKYHENNKEKVKQINQQWGLKIRDDLIKFLGNKCTVCERNEELEITSKDGSTCFERTKRFKSRTNIYIYYRNNPKKAIKDLEVLCRAHRMERTIAPLQGTSIEILLRDELIDLGIPFKHQKVIYKDKFFHMVDFFIEPNICIEADGDYWHRLPEVIERDKIVNEKLTENGYLVLRFWEKDIIKRIDWVMKIIKTNLLPYYSN